MKIYYAGCRKNHIKLLEKKPVLLSFAYNHLFWTEFRNIVLDCGAFSLWKSGKEFDKKEYAKFCSWKGYEFEFVIAPDIIGGTEEENLNSALQFQQDYSADNIVPVFHEGEDVNLIQQYLDAGFKKIALGATVSRGKASIHEWLDMVFKAFPPQDGLKYHGLGMTQKTTLIYYRDLFDSVDSTTWLAFNKYGIDANKYLLNDRSTDFLMRLGLLVLEDISAYSSRPEFNKEQREMAAIKTGKNLLDLIDEEENNYV